MILGVEQMQIAWRAFRNPPPSGMQPPRAIRDFASLLHREKL